MLFDLIIFLFYINFFSYIYYFHTDQTKKRKSVYVCWRAKDVSLEKVSISNILGKDELKGLGYD